jgi:hypothetical protein
MVAVVHKWRKDARVTEEAESAQRREAAEAQAAPERGGFTSTRSHAALAYLATRRWPRFFGYGLLIAACQVVRTALRA